MGYLLMAQQGAQGQAGGGSLLGMFLPFVLIILVVYFFMIRPQQKRQKEHQRMLADLKKGDRVLTTGGMYATIFGFSSDDENKVVLKISDDVKMEFLKSAIAQKVS
jgi:preprotein translocase subunit YajC